MNPILLKPTSEIGSQVVLFGSVSENMSAKDYHHKKDKLFGSAAEALNRLRRQFDLIVMDLSFISLEKVVRILSEDVITGE